MTQFKQNNTDERVVHKPLSENGFPVNLDGATAEFYMVKGDVTYINAPAYVDEANDQLVYEFTAQDTLYEGVYTGEFRVVFQDGTIKHYPEKGYLKVTIDKVLNPDETTASEENIALYVSEVDVFKAEVNAKVETMEQAASNAQAATITANEAATHAQTQGDYAKQEADRLVGTDVSVLDNKIGNLSGLQTAEKGSLVGAINEHTKQLSDLATPNKTIYVDQSVVSSGDGSQNSPFKTIKEAVDAVASFPNNTKIFIKAGVYKERVVISGRFTYKGGWLTLEGEVDVNNIPLTIIDGIDNDKPNGIYISDGSQVITKNILCRNFRNYTGVTTASGIVVERAKLYTINTYVKDCDYAGINANISGRLLTQGGTVENCRIGVRAYGNSVITVGYSSVPTSIKNCTEAGVLAASHSNGHVDYSVLDGNAVGVKLETISRLHIMLCEIKNANIGVVSYNGSTFFDDRNTYTGIAWANQLSYSFSADDSRRDLKSSLYRTLDTSKVTHTGTVTKTAYKKATIPVGTLAYGSSAIRIKVFGKINTLTSQQTATVECSYGATSLYGFVSNGNIDQTYSLTYELMTSGSTTMTIHLLHTQGTTIKSQNVYSAGRNPSANNDFNVSITLANASDSVTIDGVIIEEIYS